jgi:hypothetical protein
MTNFPSARSSKKSGLPYTIGRKIIVEHETLKLITLQSLDLLFVRGGSQSHHREYLGLTAGEKSGPVGAG